MKTNLERILELIQLHFPGGSGGATTQYIADALQIKRTNASALLNRLVQQGKIEKINGRPVLYCAAGTLPQAFECFESIVGRDGSLRRAVKLIKAAMGYPGKSLNLLILGSRGTGKSLFADIACKYAIESGVLLPDAPTCTFDCRNYVDDDERTEKALFGAPDAGGLLEGMRRGLLIIDNAHLLSPRLRGMLCDALERIASDDGPTAPIVVAAAESDAADAADELRSGFPIVIELPPLGERPFEERLELISRFLTLESARAGKTLTVSAELLRCLLLYDCDYNVSQLKGDIKIGCANAYVRELSSGSGSIELSNADFDHSVRKGFLNYRKHRNEIEKLIDPEYSYSFSENRMKMSPVDKDKLRYHENIYSDIDQRVRELKERGMGGSEIALLLETELEAEFNTYRAQLAKRAVNREQLTNLVDSRVIELVEAFLARATDTFNESYPPSVHYGLCLHIDSLMRAGTPRKVLAPAQITDIIENHKTKYLLSFQLALQLEQTFGIKLPVDEIVLITMFICFEAPAPGEPGSPSLLFAFHGDRVASALAASVNTVTGLGNVSGVDIPYGMTSAGAYKLLTQAVQKEDRGFGLVIVFDANATRDMFLSIAEETGTELRFVQLPITQMCIEWARNAATESNLDRVYKDMLTDAAVYGKAPERVVVTLCTTGEGGAAQLKEYIEKNGGIDGCTVVPLAVSDKDALREKLSELMTTSVIECVIG
ncbi:MAG: PRD domain-containing protein, partial [Oscillospiraceae bacterium]|nr:PRD domain-containing protein [Oscillospiraceae bacterium]